MCGNNKGNKLVCEGLLLDASQESAWWLTCQLRAEKEAPQSSMPTNGCPLAAEWRAVGEAGKSGERVG